MGALEKLYESSDKLEFNGILKVVEGMALLGKSYYIFCERTSTITERLVTLSQELGGLGYTVELTERGGDAFLMVEWAST